ncbi:ABC-type Fe3+ transport system protein [Caenispirillum salinarum AK4]|uniref:ABC-type Fe3+ transport system protein n=1 Tax=Caenispirillum salinarum AK4 TaxID=1238182 RepID=K9H2I0_9PROT|nr:cytochrome c [Caenispirillum salinarum]EKV31782.1 ABC-type Fe3+ transport system protein [Caenispirillum salinarum AK4]
MTGRHLLPLLLCLLPLAACPDMADQKRPDMAEPEPVLRGPTSSLPVPGTVARGERSAWDVLKDRPEMTPALLERGRERFNIYCAPCHGVAGHGSGLIVERGFPAPPSFHNDRLRDATPGHFLSVIENGFGVMYPYGDRVRPADRWAVVAYIRALQLSQHAQVSELPEPLRERLP